MNLTREIQEHLTQRRPEERASHRRSCRQQKKEGICIHTPTPLPLAHWNGKRVGQGNRINQLIEVIQATLCGPLSQNTTAGHHQWTPPLFTDQPCLRVLTGYLPYPCLRPLVRSSCRLV